MLLICQRYLQNLGYIKGSIWRYTIKCHSTRVLEANMIWVCLIRCNIPATSLEVKIYAGCPSVFFITPVKFSVRHLLMCHNIRYWSTTILWAKVLLSIFRSVYPGLIRIFESQKFRSFQEICGERITITKLRLGGGLGEKKAFFFSLKGWNEVKKNSEWLSVLAK